MQIASASSLTTTPISNSPSATDAVAQMQRYASILSDSSTASDQDKVNAYIDIAKMWGNVGGWYANSTQDQRNAVTDAFNNSSISKQIQAATDQFNTAGFAADAKDSSIANGGVTAADAQYNRLNALSPLEQQMVFAGTATLTQVPTLDDWKAQLKAEDSHIPGFTASLTTLQSAVTVSLSDAAKAALANSNSASATTTASTSAAQNGSTVSGATDPAKQALQTLTATQPNLTEADVALSVLQNAAQAAAKAERSGDQNSNNGATSATSANEAAPASKTQNAYQAGDAVSVIA